ncbi:MAG TPA: hypothetical protein ENK19_05550 [Acidobacteria bacterium]|nr:hypothetical protein [Acidobacteriota bacterium]
MTTPNASFAARVIRLYLDAPDTPSIPSTSDWEIARDLHRRRIPFETIRLAFMLAFIRRHNSTSHPLPPIRSLAYFRTVALNLSPEERDSHYAAYIEHTYNHLRSTSPQKTAPKNQKTALLRSR